MNHDISDTAFVVNESRSMRVDISRDIYAHLWVTDEARRLWQELAAEVYPFDDISSSLRNRFYLEHVSRFVAGNANPAFVNIAAGFSNYPFLLDRSCFAAEVDFAHVMEYKQQRIAQWQSERKLPQLQVARFGADLDAEADRGRLSAALQAWCGARPSFVMMEGLTYYLSRPVFEDLLSIVADAQAPGSRLAFEYWTPDAETYPVFVRLKQYLAKSFGVQHRYQLLDAAFVENVAGYDLQESSDIDAQELLYSDSRAMQDKNNRLPIRFAVLARR